MRDTGLAENSRDPKLKQNIDRSCPSTQRTDWTLPTMTLRFRHEIESVCSRNLRLFVFDKSSYSPSKHSCHAHCVKFKAETLVHWDVYNKIDSWAGVKMAPFKSDKMWSKEQKFDGITYDWQAAVVVPFLFFCVPTQYKLSQFEIGRSLAKSCQSKTLPSHVVHMHMYMGYRFKCRWWFHSALPVYIRLKGFWLQNGSGSSAFKEYRNWRFKLVASKPYTVGWS